MRPFQTIARILIATSVVNCALAAPSPEQETQERRALLSDGAKTVIKSASLAGIVAGGLSAAANVLQKQIANGISGGNRRRNYSRSITLPENDAISRRLANLSDEDLRILSFISRRAIESLD